jgi:adenylosuccinate lyase
MASIWSDEGKLATWLAVEQAATAAWAELGAVPEDAAAAIAAATPPSAERVVIPDSFLALDYVLDRFTWLVGGLVVRPERMRRNLEASHYLFFSQRVLNALVEAGLGRDDAYRLVQRASMRAWEEELDFRELCRTDDEIASRVDLDATFDLTMYTRHVDTVFARLESVSSTKGEPAHA